MSSTLTARELNFLGQIWQCLKSAPEVDMEKLTRMAGYKTKASTNTAYHKLKTKIMAAGNAAEDAEANAEDSAAPSPAVKKGRGKKAAPTKPEESEDEADQAVSIKPTTSGRPSRAAMPRAAVSKPAPAARPKTVRATRASVKTNKLDVQVSEDSDEDVIEPVGKRRTIKRGSTPEEDWNTVSHMIMQAAGADPTADPEDVAAPTHGIKRAATQVPSDVEDFDVKRVKNDDEVVDSIETPPASDVASFGDTVPSDTEVDMTADLTQVTGFGELEPDVAEI